LFCSDNVPDTDIVPDSDLVAGRGAGKTKAPRPEGHGAEALVQTTSAGSELPVSKV
jgi:hypothetical protein